MPKKMVRHNLCASSLTTMIQTYAIMDNVLKRPQQVCLIFSLGRTIAHIGTIYTIRSPIFQKTRNSLMLEMEVEDPFIECGIEAIAPSVVLKWKGGKFALNEEEMTVSTDYDYNGSGHAIALIRGSFKGSSRHDRIDINSASPELAAQMYFMYYNGERRQARKYLDSCWPEGRPGKSAYWAAFIREMKKSPYWPEIRALNHRKRLALRAH